MERGGQGRKKRNRNVVGGVCSMMEEIELIEWNRNNYNNSEEEGGRDR
jgi:hypothetical protein